MECFVRDTYPPLGITIGLVIDQLVSGETYSWLSPNRCTVGHLLKRGLGDESFRSLTNDMTVQAGTWADRFKVLQSLDKPSPSQRKLQSLLSAWSLSYEDLFHLEHLSDPLVAYAGGYDKFKASDVCSYLKKFLELRLDLAAVA